MNWTQPGHNTIQRCPRCLPSKPQAHLPHTHNTNRKLMVQAFLLDPTCKALSEAQAPPMPPFRLLGLSPALRAGRLDQEVDPIDSRSPPMSPHTPHSAPWALPLVEDGSCSQVLSFCLAWRRCCCTWYSPLPSKAPQHDLPPPPLPLPTPKPAASPPPSPAP